MTLADTINEMILKIVESLEITSANPTHTNTVIQANELEKPDLEAMISGSKGGTPTKAEKKTAAATKKVELWDKGNVGEMQNFTQEQFGNVKSMATNPASFIFQTFLRKFTKGAGITAFALLIFEAVQWIIGELLKPGRWLDRRFRRDIEHEILAFRSREEKQKLNQGLTNVIVTTIGGLRGGAGQTFNTYRGAKGEVQLFNKNFLAPQTVAEGSDISKSKGRKRFGE